MRTNTTTVSKPSPRWPNSRTPSKNQKRQPPTPKLANTLASLLSAAEAERSQTVKAKATAAKADAAAQEKADAEAKHKEVAGAADEVAQRDYGVKLLDAVQKLKSTKGLTYEFIVCDAKPLGLMVAKEISAAHRAQLLKLTGGKRFFPAGTCSFVDGKYQFSLENPISGLAPRLQESIKHFTGKKLPIVAGGESADGAAEETPPAEPAASEATPGQTRLAKAPELWNQTRNSISNSIDQLKRAINAALADQNPDALAGLDQKLARLDAVNSKFDQRLAESLSKAHALQDPAARKAELATAKVVLVDYIQYVKSEPLIAHIDANPFGVKTNLKQTLAESLTKMAQAIG